MTKFADMMVPLCSDSHIFCRHVCAVLTFYVAGLIVLHCALYDYSTSYVAFTFSMRCQQNITLPALHITDFTVNPAVW